MPGEEARRGKKAILSFWVCGWIVFATQERLICGSTDPNLTHGFDRYAPYRAIVEQDPHPGFVYPDGSPQIALLNRLLTRSHVLYQRFVVPGYVIYKMDGRIPTLQL